MAQQNVSRKSPHGLNRSHRGPNYQSRDVKGKQVKKMTSNTNVHISSDKQNTCGNAPMHIDVVNHTDKTQAVDNMTQIEKEKKKKFEQLCLDIMRKKQDEMWNQFKEGKYNDDFLGAVGVYNYAGAGFPKKICS
ncbi:hypothetical protein RIF29_07370 [Crotalaria pallida]|uniref:Uncharacterized protein n=1 Tax=Crotalaria pallida TaxID=3830 RepID=A0AAN9PAT0_CROPI